ncbi:MAG: lysine--tRNA ligase [Gammaproteobacteria bacterium]|nr:MAG: lysine--tRNA ligase [Gammaproteobacteria bacterium]
MPKGIVSRRRLQPAFSKARYGDLIGVVGTLFRTRTGELTVQVEDIRLLVKGLRPFPDKFHGLADVETRYRRRYVDLIVNEQSREIFRRRAQITTSLRRFLDQRGYLEIESPMMQVIPGGANARPFITHHNALGIDLFMRVAQELYIKRCLVGGFERVYEMNRNFRNEGLSTEHNPEFTMLEYNEAYLDYVDYMDLTEEMLRTVTEEVTGSAVVEYQGHQIDLGTPFRRLSLAEAVRSHHEELSEVDCKDAVVLRRHLASLGVEAATGSDAGELLLEVFEHTVEGTLIQPTFITGHPVAVSPLSRRSASDPDVTDRFELFIAGRELANGFSELNDPQDQEERLKRQASEKAGGDEEAMFFDQDYIDALEYGLPPNAGGGIGIDRFVMLLTDSRSIRDVLLFPHLRPEA